MPTGYEYLLTKRRIQSAAERSLAPQIESLLLSAKMRLAPLLPNYSSQQSYKRDDVLLLLILFSPWLEGEWLDELSAAFTAEVDPANEMELAFWQRNGYPIPSGVADSVAETFQSERNWARIASVTLNHTVNGILQWDAAEGLTRRDLDAHLAYWYSQNRARNIASNETTALNSILTKEYMQRLGLRRWIWWTTPPEWTICKFCRDRHGVIFDITDPMPPDAAHPRCKCVPEVLFD
jgi:hypothetical protein